MHSVSSSKAIRALAIASVLMIIGTSGCATKPQGALAGAATASLHGDASRPTTDQGWLRSELYFGVGIDGGLQQVDAAHWQAFLDREVTPRFPDGLTVIDAYGQWLSRDQSQPGRLRSKQLVILHPDTPEHRARIDAIRLAWKRETGHQSVLWSWQRVGVSF